MTKNIIIVKHKLIILIPLLFISCQDYINNPIRKSNSESLNYSLIKDALICGNNIFPSEYQENTEFLVKFCPNDKEIKVKGDIVGHWWSNYVNNCNDKFIPNETDCYPNKYLEEGMEPKATTLRVYTGVYTNRLEWDFVFCHKYKVYKLQNDNWELIAVINQDPQSCNNTTYYEESKPSLTMIGNSSIDGPSYKVITELFGKYYNESNIVQVLYGPTRPYEEKQTTNFEIK